MRGAVLLLPLLVVGCAWSTAPVVRVPVPVPCVKEKPPRPHLVTEAELKDMPNGQAIPALEQHRVLSEAYIGELEAVVDACAAVPTSGASGTSSPAR